jgi:hypothetical protein
MFQVRKYKPLFVLVFISNILYAQKIELNSEKKGLSIYKKEIIFGLGATQYIGDIGGTSSGDFSGAEFGKKRYGIADMNLQTTSFGGMFGYRYRFNKIFATVSSLNFGYIKEDDALSRDLVKRQRNLHFRTFIVDYQQRLEVTLLGLSRYNSETNIAKHTEQIYIFGGVGVCHFNPKAKYQGDWIDLKPLSTEGEGIKGSKIKDYSLFTPIVPIGFGFRIGIGEIWRFGIEATYVKTFTDYLDDVSGVYFDPAKLKSEAAKYLSNPSTQNSNWYGPGQIRGNPNTKDSYYFLNFTLSKNLTIKKVNTAKKKSNPTYKRPI